MAVQQRSCFKTIITILSFILILINGTICQTSSKQRRLNNNKVNCNQTAFESNFDKLLVIGSPERNFPENQQQLKQFCSESQELFELINQQKNRCLKETFRNFVSIIVYAMKSSIRKICTRKQSPKVIALIDASNCINRNKSPINKCMERSSNYYAAIKFVDNSLKIPYICCQFVELIECFSQVMNKNGCQDKLPILLENIIGVLGNFIDSTCGEYNLDTDKCLHLPKLSEKKAHSKSFVTNLIDIFNSV